MTGGLPPNVALPCAAHSAYRALYRRVLLQNAKFYARFPEDVAQVQRIVHHLASQPDGGVRFPSGTVLRPRYLLRTELQFTSQARMTFEFSQSISINIMLLADDACSGMQLKLICTCSHRSLQSDKQGNCSGSMMC